MVGEDKTLPTRSLFFVEHRGRACHYQGIKPGDICVL